MEDSKTNTASDKNRYQRFFRLLELIEEANRSIELSQQMDAEIMVKQNLKLKNQYVQEFVKLLSSYKIPLVLKEAA